MSPLFIPTTYSGSCSRLIRPPMLNMSWQLTQHIAVRIIFTNTELFLPSLKATFRNQKFTNSLSNTPSHILSHFHLIISWRQHLLSYFLVPKGTTLLNFWFIKLNIIIIQLHKEFWEKEISIGTQKIEKNVLEHIKWKNDMAICANTNKLASFIQRNELKH